MRRLYHLVDEEEAKEQLLSALSEMGPPLQLYFQEKTCSACGEKGDPRLMSRLGGDLGV